MLTNGKASTDLQGAQCIGWTSLAIGLSELLAPRQVQNLLGLEDSAEQRGILRVLGLREIGHGLSILTEDDPDQHMASSLWARVAGDGLDTALLGVAATKTKKPISFAAVAASVMVIGALDVIWAMRLSRRQVERRPVAMAKKGLRWAGRMAHLTD
jgi:hypothetical protein